MEKHGYPLITAKILPPETSHSCIHRSCLERTVLEASRLSGILLYISAPPGFGKTTFLSSVASLWTTRVAWLSIDHYDNDQDYFYAYLKQALEKGSIIGAAKTNRAVISEKNHRLLTLLRETGATNEPALIVLENLHEIENPEIIDDLRFFIKHLPSHLTFAVSMREDIFLPLSILRCEGRVVEIRSEDLAAEDDEVKRYFSLSGIDIPTDSSAHLLEKLGGWWACIKLFSVAWMQKSEEERPLFVERFRGTNRFVVEFLTECVYTTLPEECARAASCLAVPEFFNEDLAEAILDPESLDFYMGSLTRAQLLTVKESAPLARYRFHPLVRDYLRSRLDSETKREIHLLTAAWLEGSGLEQRAAQHREIANRSASSRAVLQAGRTGSVCALSRREKELLHSLEDGLSNDEIGRRLFISPGTVKWHLHNIYEKLHVRSRTEAVSRARKLGLI